jgi:hypothetical protein
MSNIDFTPTAFTVKDPGNGKDRRYEAVTHPRSVSDAAREFSRLAEEYPALVAMVVPDHFIQIHCQTQDNNSWSGGYGVSADQGRMILLNLLESAAKQNRFS